MTNRIDSLTATLRAFDAEMRALPNDADFIPLFERADDSIPADLTADELDAITTLIRDFDSLLRDELFDFITFRFADDN